MPYSLAPLPHNAFCLALKTLQTKHLSHEDLKKYDGMLTYSRDKRRQVALAERFAELWAQQGEAIGCWRSGPSYEKLRPQLRTRCTLLHQRHGELNRTGPCPGSEAPGQLSASELRCTALPHGPRSHDGQEHSKPHSPHQSLPTAGATYLQAYRTCHTLAGYPYVSHPRRLSIRATPLHGLPLRCTAAPADRAPAAPR